MALVTDRAIFIHVPKTGGTFVRAAIANLGIACQESGDFDVEDHYGIDEVRAAHPELCETRQSFGFVRHPVAWLKSRWAWAIRTDFSAKRLRQADAARHWMARCWSDDFEVFVRRYLEREPGVCGRTMLGMLGVWGAGPPVDYVGRREWLVPDLVRILSRVGHAVRAGPIAETVPQRVGAADPEMAARCKIPPHLEREILAAESALVERFGYH